MKNVIGIDLGTSNSAMAVANADESLQIVEIPQMLNAKQQVTQSLLPSVVFQMSEHENVVGPFVEVADQDHVVGAWAREKAQENPERAVLSSKSWLSANYVARKEPILPWGSDIKEKMSPVCAAEKVLKHLEAAWKASEFNDASRTVVTVPASFDETARQLTMQAIETSEFPNVQLLEEPQAAFYSWLDQNPDWREKVQPGNVILVCDVGGGTTDLTLILAYEKDGVLELERIAVGSHLLLGGDNMDLALAMNLKAELGELDLWQMQSLIQSCRAGKEQLWKQPELENIKISVASRSSKLFAKTKSANLTRELLERVILDGFFPSQSKSELPKKQIQSGLVEMGLRYVHDPAITKHIAEFLTNAVTKIQSSSELNVVDTTFSNGIVVPDAILFNGGVFHATEVRDRVLSTIRSWGEGKEICELVPSSFDTAVAMGAAAYGRLCETGKGIKVRAGTTCSYYLGVENSGMAIPGMPVQIKGLCVVPLGSEEGVSLDLPDQVFGLVVGQPVEFQFFQSAERSEDQLGDVVENADQCLQPAGKLSTKIELKTDVNEQDLIPVHLHSYVSDIGVLELALKQVGSDSSWKLEFDVRD